MDRSQLALTVDVLGPLTLRVDGAMVDVPGPQRRALLALLALSGSRPVSQTRLIDALWPDEAPDNAASSLHNHVSRLRGHLRPYDDRLTREAAGYRLHLQPFELDVDAVRRLSTTEPGSALALWNGSALGEFDALPGFAGEAVALNELRLDLLDADLEQRLSSGDRSVAADAAAASAAAPYRESTALVHVRALAAHGRVAEAMAAAQEFRRRLADDTGLDPSPALAVLEQRVASGSVEPARRFVKISRPDGPLIGRQQDREELERLLAGRGVVTLTGPGGVGKTRLAFEVSADRSDTVDVVVVGLAAIEQPGHVLRAVASALGLHQDVNDVRDIAHALGDRALLLVLDNCEHVVDACSDLVVAIRRHAPRVQVLATSRMTLGVPDEYVVRLQPLPVPRSTTDLDQLQRQSSVKAFVEHVRRRQPDYRLAAEEADDLVEVLRSLDGLPLGIELAARQHTLMPVRAIRDRLDRALDLGTGRAGPADQRQRTLRATIASSYQLLEQEERDLLLAIAPFVGGVDLTTAESLAAPGAGDPLDLLHRLVDCSLLVANPAAGRYRLLFTVRAFLLDELIAADQRAAMNDGFVSACVRTAEEIAASMFSRDEAATNRRLRAELDNFRAALDLAGTDSRIRIITKVNSVAVWRGLRELWDWAIELAEDPRLVDHPQRAEILSTGAGARRMLGDLDGAESWAREALEVAGPDVESDHELAEATPEARAWSVLGVVAHFRGDFDAAREGWLRAADSAAGEACSFVGSAALAAGYQGDMDAAAAYLNRAHLLAACGSDDAFLAYVRGEHALADRPEQAVAHYVEAIATATLVGSTFIEGVARVSLAAAQVRTGDVRGAAKGFGYLFDLWRGTGQETQLWTTARNAARLFADVGRPRTAALLLICADAAPGAPAVNESIARRSGRTYTAVESLIEPDMLTALRAEAVRLGTGAVLDQAREELAALVGPAGR